MNTIPQTFTLLLFLISVIYSAAYIIVATKPISNEYTDAHVNDNKKIQHNIKYYVRARQHGI